MILMGVETQEIDERLKSSEPVSIREELDQLEAILRLRRYNTAHDEMELGKARNMNEFLEELRGCRTPPAQQNRESERA